MKYPAHIYEKIRFEVASSIISHELKKIFAGFAPDEYSKLEAQVYDWPFNPKKYSLTKEPRDFWNGVEGIMTGFRLKGVVKLITAENVWWSKEELDPQNLVFVTDHFSVNDIKIPTLNVPAPDVFSWLKDNNLIEAATKKVDTSFSVGIPRVDDPIYCQKEKGGKYLALDGNGRLMHALLKGRSKLPAYVGLLNDEEPVNYWVYTMFLINLGSLHKKEIISTSEYIRIMRTIFKSSEVAKIEYADRVSDDPDLKSQILANIEKKIGQQL